MGYENMIENVCIGFWSSKQSRGKIVPDIEKVIGICLVFSQLCNKIVQFIKSAHADGGPRSPCSHGYE